MSEPYELLPSTNLDDSETVPAGNFSEWLATQQNSDAADVPCGSCNACCRSSYFIHIRPDEQDALDHIPAELLFPAPGLPTGHVLMGYNEQGTCPMLIENQCSIYEHRPQTCRDFDCRVFAATGIAAGGKEKAQVNHQAAKWRFEVSGDQEALPSIEAATAFITQHADEFQAEVLPTNPTQLALLILKLGPLFAPQDNTYSTADRVAQITHFIQTTPRGSPRQGSDPFS